MENEKFWGTTKFKLKFVSRNYLVMFLFQKHSSDEDVHFSRLKHKSSNTRWKIALGVVIFLAIVACLIIWLVRPKYVQITINSYPVCINVVFLSK